MLANELRIGNYVKFSNYEAHKLERCEFNYTEDFANIEDYNPIELTEDWLIRFGFKKDDNGNFWVDLQTHYFELMICSGGVFPAYVQIQEFSHELEQRVNFNSINYIHQLQNMYYCLTGKELELKS